MRPSSAPRILFLGFLFTVIAAAFAAPQEKARPSAFLARGRLVCLLEEMKAGHQAEISPIHDHVLGFRIEGEPRPGGLRYYTILRNGMSERLFVDARYKERELRIFGRVFPATAILEVSHVQWFRDGALLDVSYWCEICSIRGVDPTLCACCQEKVELRESPAEADREK